MHPDQFIYHADQFIYIVIVDARGLNYSIQLTVLNKATDKNRLAE